MSDADPEKKPLPRPAKLQITAEKEFNSDVRMGDLVAGFFFGLFGAFAAFFHAHESVGLSIVLVAFAGIVVMWCIFTRGARRGVFLIGLFLGACAGALLGGICFGGGPI